MQHDMQGHGWVMGETALNAVQGAVLFASCYTVPRLPCMMQITPGAHSSEAAVNKQLNDKERVAAALENPNLLDMVNRCV
jgi:hypothetical protein